MTVESDRPNFLQTDTDTGSKKSGSRVQTVSSLKQERLQTEPTIEFKKPSINIKPKLSLSDDRDVFEQRENWFMEQKDLKAKVLHNIK